MLGSRHPSVRLKGNFALPPIISEAFYGLFFQKGQKQKLNFDSSVQLVRSTYNGLESDLKEILTFENSRAANLFFKSF